jgi:hypothetical protein
MLKISPTQQLAKQTFFSPKKKATTTFSVHITESNKKKIKLYIGRN